MMDTSVEARPAKSAAATLRDKAFDVIASCPNGATTHEVAAVLRLTVAAVQPRISELKADHRIVDTGLRRTNESGKKAAVFATPPKGTTPDQLNLFSQRH